MPIVRNGSIRQADLVTIIDEAIRKVEAADGNIVQVRYSIGPDQTGEDSIFFRVVLTDVASDLSDMARFGQVTRRIATALNDGIKPSENWGIFPYFSFRSNSEHVALNDPAWA